MKLTGNQFVTSTCSIDVTGGGAWDMGNLRTKTDPVYYTRKHRPEYVSTRSYDTNRDSIMNKKEAGIFELGISYRGERI